MTIRYNRNLTGVYNLSLPALQDGDTIETQIDVHGRILVAVDVLPTHVATSDLQSAGNLTLSEILTAQATAALQVASNATLSTISAKLTSPITVTGPVTDTQLRASPVPVSGAFFPVTQPVSGSVSVTNLPATQPVSGSVSVNNFPATQAVTGTFFPATQPVSIASMPSTPVTGTFFQATQPVSVASMPSTPVTGVFFQTTQPVSLASTPLPALAATSTLQTTGNTSLSSIDTKTPALVSGRQPVDGSGVIQPISVVSLPLPVGAATAANQVMNGAAIQANLTVAVAAVAMRVGAANQVGRKQLIILANAAGYSYGFTAVSQPFSLTNGVPLILNLGENITVWAIKTSGTNTIAVAELN